MCGFYVHGRSWVVGHRDITDAELLVMDEIGAIKAEGDLWPNKAVTCTGAQTRRWSASQVNLAQQKMSQHYKNTLLDSFLYGKLKYLVDPALPTSLKDGIDKAAYKWWRDGVASKKDIPEEVKLDLPVAGKQVPIYQHFCKRMECNAHNEMPQVPDGTPANSPSLQSFDWGVQPWDGKVVNQRTMMNPRLKNEIDQQGYMMNTRKDLYEWCGKHWGKHEDWGEWASSAYNFFDLDKFLSFLPIKYKKGISEYRLGTLAGQLAHGLLIDSDNPVEVFADMMDDAPNDYWKGK